MILQSHGSGSSLLEHLEEVCLAAENLEERIISACHDTGKATIVWQSYIRGEIKKSPHNHAATGGLLASLLIKELNRSDAKVWSLAALHAGAAHHSFIGILMANKDEFFTVSSDKQAQDFFCKAIPNLLPEIPKSLFSKVWSTFQELAPSLRQSFREYNKWLQCSGEDKLKAFIIARSILGRLCFQDHQSAAKQSGNSESIVEWENAYPSKPFCNRPAKVFPASIEEVHRLRTELKVHFHDCLKTDSSFYFIDAPTGLGKTETMLSAAEILVQDHDLDRIIFSVPQISIADQIYEEYFSDKTHAQIWNYIRQEKSYKNNSSSIESVTDNTNPSFTLDVALQPFSESYNITTFNQVLLAMCHPLRTRCIRGIGLRDAVIIMDEFHKLSLTVLPYFFRIAKEYAKVHNCRFILGSATPLEKYSYLALENAIGIDSALTKPIYSNPIINQRRIYKNIGSLTIDMIAEKIETFHESSGENLLVVLNLISKGTWPLLKKFIGTYNPWQQLENLCSGESNRVIIFLDGLVPPILRREIVLKCKEVMKTRPVTLVTTQMVEVGVDLDFDHGLIDYQGLASTIQRGGRIGREGRANNQSCTVEVFSLIDDEDKNSFQILCDVQEKYDDRMKSHSFHEVAQKTLKFWKKEMRVLKSWTKEETLRDTDLVSKLREIQEKLLATADGSKLIDLFFASTAVAGNTGVDYIVAQNIAEIFGENQGTKLLILKNHDEYEVVSDLTHKLNFGQASASEKKRLNKFVVDHSITVFSPSVITELGLEEVGIISCLENLKCLKAESSIF